MNLRLLSLFVGMRFSGCQGDCILIWLKTETWSPFKPCRPSFLSAAHLYPGVLDKLHLKEKWQQDQFLDTVTKQADNLETGLGEK